MTQGVLSFKYVEEKKSSGMTALAGLPLYLDLVFVSQLGKSINEHLTIKRGKQGWSDVENILCLILLNLAGGECVDDLSVLKKDEGFAQVLVKALTQGMRQRDRRKFEKLWNEKLLKGQAIPSATSIFRYLSHFHDEEQEARRVQGTAFIPQPNEHLKGLSRINAELVKFIQMYSLHHEATLDIDATLVETCKSKALFCYKGFKSYQPLNVYWDEQGIIVLSEYRDGNVPAGHEQLRVFIEALAMMPPDVMKVSTRSDTAGYQIEFLKYCAEGRNERFGIIDFAVGADVTPEFKKAVAELSEEEWKPLCRIVNGKEKYTGQDWAEVCFVPNWVGHSKKSPEYRYIALREALIERTLPGLEDPQLTLPFPTMDFPQKGKYKLFGIVTNRTISAMPGEEVIRWYRKRCGKSEEAHSVMKEDFAGGKLPSGDFGVNAAWWGIMILAFNLNSAMKRLVLKGDWVEKRMKAIRFALINLPGRIVHHGRELIIKLTGGHGSNSLLVQARERILALLSRAPGLT
jgi:hypothetical protein